MANNASQSVSVFCSYAREDESYRDELDKALAPLRVAKLISDWHDRKILAGADWDDVIEQKLRQADVILFLVSSDLFNSKYVENNELPIALRRHEAGEAVVIPIIARKCLWSVTPLHQLNATPTDGKPIAKWQDIDDAFTEVAQAVHRVVKELVAQKVPETIQDLHSDLGRHWNVPYPRNRFFVGRAKELGEVEKALAAARPVVLSGGGGLGKSEIATEFAHRNRERYPIVWWLRAEARESLLADMAGLARELALPEAGEQNLEEVAAAVRAWLAANPGWLLLLDNAANPQALDGLLPDPASGHLIITSRHPDWEEPYRPVPIEPWSLEDSVRYLEARSGSADRDSLKLIATALGQQPLALAQAAAQLERGEAA